MNKENHEKRVKVPTILQMEMVECGAACLAMILAQKQCYIPLEKIRIDCDVGRDGVSASALVKAAKSYGFQAKGFRKNPEELKNMTMPVILHWNFNHFVVLEGFSKKGKVYLNDPAAGRRVITEEELDLAFTGVVLTLGNESVPQGSPPGMLPSLLKRIQPVKQLLVYLVLVGLLLVIPAIIIPSFSKIFMDDILLSGQRKWLLPLVKVMILTLIVQMSLKYMQAMYLFRVETKIALLGSSSFLWHVLRLPVVFFQQRYASDISSRMSSNQTVATFLSRELTENVIYIISLVFYTIIMWSYSPLLTTISVILASSCVIYFFITQEKMEQANIKLQQDLGTLYGVSASGLSMVETLKATSSESIFFERWAGYHGKVLNGQQILGKINIMLKLLPETMYQMVEIVVISLGAFEIMSGNMTLGTLVAFQNLLFAFMTPILELTQVGLKIKVLKADMIRLDDIFKYEVESRNDDKIGQGNPNQNMDEFGKLKGSITLENLSFGYRQQSAPLLSEFHLNIQAGEHVALVGSSGSGKSSVTKIVTGVFPPWSGTISFDEIPREDLPLHLLHNSISVVDQDISLFEGTIEDNLRMWDETIPKEQIITAAKDACIHEDIMKRPGGYLSRVEEDGRNFSGGQIQRLEIARALSMNPSILILDEATSALDVATEKLVMQRIKERSCTCLIVAHRLSTIRDCDQIIVLQKGKVQEFGTHEQLMEEDGFYRELIQSASM